MFHCGRITDSRSLASVREQWGGEVTVAGADACDKEIHLSVGILPDFGAGGGPVNGGVGGVHKLTGDKAAWNFLCQLVGPKAEEYWMFSHFWN